jgi:hypothetical protein
LAVVFRLDDAVVRVDVAVPVAVVFVVFFVVVDGSGLRPFVGTTRSMTPA